MFIFVSRNLRTQSSWFTHTKLTDKSTFLKPHWLCSAPTNLVVKQGAVHLTGNAPWESRHIRRCPGHTERTGQAAPWPWIPCQLSPSWENTSVKWKPSSHGLIWPQTVINILFCTRSFTEAREYPEHNLILLLFNWLSCPSHMQGLGVCANTRVLICSVVVTTNTPLFLLNAEQEADSCSSSSPKHPCYTE